MANVFQVVCDNCAEARDTDESFTMPDGWITNSDRTLCDHCKKVTILTTDVDIGMTSPAFDPVLLALAQAEDLTRRAGDEIYKQLDGRSIIRVTISAE